MWFSTTNRRDGSYSIILKLAGSIYTALDCVRQRRGSLALTGSGRGSTGVTAGYPQRWHRRCTSVGSQWRAFNELGVLPVDGHRIYSDGNPDCALVFERPPQ